MDLVLEFDRVFRAEIQAVRAVRNAVVHESERVSLEDIEQAIEIARRLNEALAAPPFRSS